MIDVIPLRNNWRFKINLDDAPNEIRKLDSFLWRNDAPKCFVRGQGGWYKLTKEGSLLFVARVLYTLSYKEWHKVAMDDNFTANIK